MTFLAALWSKIWGYVVAAGAGAALLFGIWAKARSEGKAAQQADEQRERMRAIERKRKLDDDLANSNDADLDRRADRWVRPD